MSEIHRVCYHGIAGSGKTSAAMAAALRFRSLGFLTEVIWEPTREWVFEGRSAPGYWRQLELASQQLAREMSRIESVLPADKSLVVVSDPGLWTYLWYATRVARNQAQRDAIAGLTVLAQHLDATYNTTHILMAQPQEEPVGFGRWGHGDGPAPSWDDLRAFLNSQCVRYQQAEDTFSAMAREHVRELKKPIDAERDDSPR